MNTPKVPRTPGTSTDADKDLVWPPADSGRNAPLVVDTHFGTVMSLGEAAATLKTAADRPDVVYRPRFTRPAETVEPKPIESDTESESEEEAPPWLTRQTVLLLGLSVLVIAQTVAIVLLTAQRQSARVTGSDAVAIAAPSSDGSSDSTAQGGVPGQEPASPRGGAAGRRAAVSERMSQLVVRTQPPGSSVFVDGKRLGDSPVSLSGLLPGEHMVRVESAAASVEHNVTLTAGNNAVLIAPGTTRAGWLDLHAPADVQIFERGKLLGNSAEGPVMMSTGPHRLSLRNDRLGYIQEVQVTIPAGDIARIRPSFPDGILQVNAQPWASVWLDGKPVGDTPLGNLRVSLGTHEVRFRHPELGEQLRYVTVSAQAPSRLSVDLRK